ncbi:MAG: hypothetical protein IPO07_20930 [Haliscomenobacter sp.]|nr:hypothetical protein [Haliscomenobacter sp.]MBK9490979.1 hypothetical protein [Haliscomenobacter sp.]
MTSPLLFCLSLCTWITLWAQVGPLSSTSGFTNAANFGFSPSATGLQNMQALQKAVDQGGTIQVSTPGTYKLAGTVYIGSNTSLNSAMGFLSKK